MILGNDTLGALHYKQALFASHPRGNSASIMLRTFGDARPLVEEMCKSGIFGAITLQLMRFSNAHSYEIKKLLPLILDDGKWAQSLQKQFPKTPLKLSPLTEHNLPRNRSIPVFQALKKVAPSCELINTIWKGDVIDGITTEIHIENEKPRPKPRGRYVITFDGFGGDGSVSFTGYNLRSIVIRYPDAKEIRGWDFPNNGKIDYRDKTEIDERIHWASAEQLTKQNQILRSALKKG